MHSLLRHLERTGFAGSPRVVGSGYDASGRETLSYLEGEVNASGPWTVDGAAAVGDLLRRLHAATASFQPPRDVVWFPWHARHLGGSAAPVIGHCDTGPWNIVAWAGRPMAFIDWEFAGPVDPRVELAQACWLNAKLHDDVVARREGLPPLAVRAEHLRAMVDAYGLSRQDRRGFVELIIEFVVSEVAWEADDAAVTPEMTEHPHALWAMAWRARAAAWLQSNRRYLQNALA